MATYKVIQDIEAEDKFVGPLTLKQFVFAMGGVFFAWVSFFVTTKGMPWALSIFAPLSLFGFFMAVPWSRDQPTDVWVLAKIRFRFKPKIKVWDQAGMQDLVTVTAPKVEEKNLTDGLDEHEVKSRLKALADTIDSRGWATKNASIEEALAQYNSASDRLVGPSVLPRQVPPENINVIPDVMDGNPVVDNMIQQQDMAIRSEAMNVMQQARQGGYAPAAQPEPIVAPPSEDAAPVISEDELSRQLRSKRQAGDLANKRMASISAFPSASSAKVSDDSTKTTADNSAPNEDISTMTEQVSPDILNLARNNDLNVATIARQARNDQENDNEVVVSLR